MKNLILLISSIFLLQFTIAQNTFGPEHNITYNPGDVDRIFYFDVDGDGISDLVTFSVNDGGLYWYKNFGEGDFIAAQFLVDINTDILYTSDIDNDDDIDFVYQSSNNETIRWYANDGSGNYSNEGTLLTSGDPFADFLLGDIDGDLDDDIVLVFSPMYPTMMWYSNLGGGYFSTPNMIASGWEYSGYLKQRLTDIDNDGDLDVLCKMVSSPDPFEENYYLMLFKNNDNSFSSQTIFTDYYQVPHAADLNGDGFQELISNDDNESVWFENDGNNDFINQFDLTSNLELDMVLTFDAEFDGDLDIFHASGQTKWLENKNDGTFEDDYLMSFNAGIILNGDIDLDNDDDVIIANPSSITWVENTTYTTNLSENEFVNINLFPNPASNDVIIETSLSGIIIEIINTDGQLVKNTNQSKINISDLESNIYFVKIIDKKGNVISIEKFVVIH